MNQQIIDMYLDYVNNFITAGTFAEHYGISLELAAVIIKDGKRLHEAQAEEWAA